jgi:hypothetical protein
MISAMIHEKQRWIWITRRANSGVMCNMKDKTMK